MSLTVLLNGSFICNSFEALTKFGIRYRSIKNSTVLTLPEGWNYCDNQIYDQNNFKRASVMIHDESSENFIYFHPRFEVEVFEQEAINPNMVGSSLNEQTEDDENPIRQLARMLIMNTIYSFAVYDMYNGEEPIYISPKMMFPEAQADARSWLVEYIDKYVVSLTDDSKEDLKIVRTGEESLFDDPLFDPTLYWEQKTVL